MNKADLETFLAVPLSRWRAMEDLTARSNGRPVTPVPPTTDNPEEDTSYNNGSPSTSQAQELPAVVEEEEKTLGRLPHHSTPEPVGKEMVTKYRSKHMLKLLKGLEDRKEFTSFDNLEELVRNSTTNSSREVRNEAEFYPLLLNSSLGRLCTNRFKIEKYLKGKWFKI